MKKVLNQLELRKKIITDELSRALIATDEELENLNTLTKERASEILKQECLHSRLLELTWAIKLINELGA